METATLVTIDLAILGLIIASYLIQAALVKREGTANTRQDSEIKTLFKTTKDLEDDVEKMSNSRSDDNLKFAEALSRLNLTLVRFEATVGNLDKTLSHGMTSFEKRLEEAERKVTNLMIESKTKQKNHGTH